MQEGNEKSKKRNPTIKKREINASGDHNSDNNNRKNKTFTTEIIKKTCIEYY